MVATDVPGCREVVEDGVNGLLCKPFDAPDLADKMEAMLRMRPEQHAEMGRMGSDKMEQAFDEQLVIKKYIYEIKSINI